MMAAETPKLPEIIPVFPLTGSLLLPGNLLPLNIFEPRYRNMVADALDGDQLIGMVQPVTPRQDNWVASAEGPDPDNPETYRAIGRASLAAARDDEAWCAARALVFMKQATADEQALYARFRAHARDSAGEGIGREEGDSASDVSGQRIGQLDAVG